MKVRTPGGRPRPAAGPGALSILARCLGCALVVLLYSSRAWGNERASDAYLDELIEKAAVARLSDDRYWHILLHYRPTLWGGYTSDVNDAEFFLAPEGRKDPRAELEATLRAFFSSRPAKGSAQPARCHFIGRYAWLKEVLAFDEKKLPPRKCDQFGAWLEELKPGGVSLIFPAAYLSNPSSAFGHLMLRVDQKGHTEKRLTSYAVNYTADEDSGPFGVSFPLFGILGFYNGVYSILPYYAKVLEYRDMENRDIWEYPLTLTDAQRDRMIRHVWELKDTSFDYSFATENCAYQILALIEAADASFRLTERLRWWTIPGEAVRVVVEHPGLVNQVRYRPASQTRIQQRFLALSLSERALVRKLTKDSSVARTDAFLRHPPERRKLMMDITSDYLLYRDVTEREKRIKSGKDDPDILEAIKALDDKAMPYSGPTPPTDPEKGHKSARAGLAFGWRDGDLFEELNLRAAYHDLLDPPMGHTPSAQVEILGLSLRHYEDRNQTRVERLTLVNLMNLAPIDRLFGVPSWKFNASMHTLNRADCRYCGAYRMNAGVGGAAETRWLVRELFYAFAEVEADYSHAFARNHRAGGGGTVGMLTNLTDRWGVLASASYLRFPLGEHSEDVRASLGLRYTIQQNSALRIEFNHRDREDEALLTLHAYF